MTGPHPSETGKTLFEDISHLKETAIRVAQDARDHAIAHAGDKKQRFNQALQAARDRLLEHPVAVLGVGFAVGLFFGARLRR